MSIYITIYIYVIITQRNSVNNTEPGQYAPVPPSCNEMKLPFSSPPAALARRRAAKVAKRPALRMVENSESKHEFSRKMMIEPLRMVENGEQW